MEVVEEVSGRAVPEAALSPLATEPVPVSALSGNDQPRDELPLGPYWMHTPASGEHQILAKYGNVLFRYPPDQMRLADAHLSRLQFSYSRERAMKRDAAEEMFTLIADIEQSLTADDSYRLLREACRAVLAKARGQ